MVAEQTHQLKLLISSSIVLIKTLSSEYMTDYSTQTMPSVHLTIFKQTSITLHTDECQLLRLLLLDTEPELAILCNQARLPAVELGH